MISDKQNAAYSEPLITNHQTLITNLRTNNYKVLCLN